MNTLAITALVLFCCTLLVLGGNLFCVKLDNGTCTPSCPAERCFTLAHYVNHSEKYFNSNTIFSFLSGKHHLRKPVNITDIRNLTFHGNRTFVPGLMGSLVPSSQILCDGHVGFAFAAMSELSVSNLLFSGCGMKLPGSPTDNVTHLYAALSVGDVDNNGSIYNVTISGVTVQNSTGYGFLGNNIYGRSKIMNSSFLVTNGSVHSRDPNGCYPAGNARFVYRNCSNRNISSTLQIESSSFRHGSYEFNPVCQWWYNRASGLAITIDIGTCANLVIEITNVSVTDNRGYYGGNMNILYASNNSITKSIRIANSTFANGRTSFYGGGMNIQSRWLGSTLQDIELKNCHFENNTGTALTLDTMSSITLKGNITFKHNSGYNGGALLINAGSYIDLKPNTTVVFSNNSADHAGGAIWAPSQPMIIPLCPFQCEALHNINMTFTRNHAQYAGSILYGGAVGDCNWYNWSECRNLSIYNIRNNYTNRSMISSDATRVCFCDNGAPNCSRMTINITTYPGERFTVPVATVGQRNGTVPGEVYAELKNTSTATWDARFDKKQQRVQSSKSCANLTYIVFSKPGTLTLSLKALTVMASIIPPLDVQVSLQRCPAGFFETGRYLCDCDPVLKYHGITCNITRNIIERKPPFWIGFYNATENQHESGVLLYPHCPLRYCQFNDTEMNLTNPDKQCASGRSGILCGSCKAGLSRTLGSSECRKCSNAYLALIVVFIAAGLVLVLLLFACNLTVSHGTLNGLVFYANIVWVNQPIFFPSMTPAILPIFIAWLNLDFGIPTCLFNGLDTYIKTWLEFVFPFYILLLVAVVAYLSHKSITMAHFVGNNVVNVLATLFLLSYAKMQRTIIVALSFVILTYPDGSKKALWLYDANIKYFDTKHIPLVIAALLAFLVFSLPYTAFLLFVQCIRRYGGSKSRFQKWVATLLPLFDAYTAPYKFQYQFWTGFNLVARNFIFVVFAVNYGDQPGVNLMAIGIASLLIFMIALSFGGVYRKTILGILNYAFLLNLGILSIASLHTLEETDKQESVTFVSVGIAFVMFACILVYHFLEMTSIGKATQKLFLSKVLKELKRLVAKTQEWMARQRKVYEEAGEDEDEFQSLLRSPSDAAYREPILQYLSIPKDSEDEQR